MAIFPKTDTAVIQADVGAASAATLGSLYGILGNPAAAVSTTLGTVATQTGSNEATGTFSVLNVLTEQVVVTISPTNKRWIVHGIWLDMVNLTQNGTIKTYFKIDGANYREVTSDAFTVATDSDGSYLTLSCGIDQDFKVTYTAGGVEGAARDLPYRIIYSIIEA